MSENLKAHVIATVKSMMKPIIMLLLRNGVTYKEFASLSKSIFVEAAAQDYGIRGRPTNISRIAVLTGLDRKEVKRIKTVLNDNPLALEAQTSQDRITRILSAWHKDPEFCDTQGIPLVLTLEGDQGSFQSLVRRYGGDVPRQALFKEMLRANVIEKIDDRIKALSRYFFPAQQDPQALLRAGSVISELGETLFHNLYLADPSKTQQRFKRRLERRATNNSVDAKYAKAFNAYLEQEGQAFLERIDAWLIDHETNQTPQNNKESNCDADQAQRVRLGVGLYAIQKTQHEVDD